jgi:hypothetical protein
MPAEVSSPVSLPSLNHPPPLDSRADFIIWAIIIASNWVAASSSFVRLFGAGSFRAKPEEALVSGFKSIVISK